MKGKLGGLHTFIVVVPSINAVIHCNGSLLSDVMILAGTSDRAYVAMFWVMDCGYDVETV